MAVGLLHLVNPAIYVGGGRATLSLAKIIKDQDCVLRIALSFWQSVLRRAHARGWMFNYPAIGDLILQVSCGRGRLCLMGVA